MQTINRDFPAFLAKLKATACVYEKRNAPDLAGTIEAMATGLDEFKREQRAELEKLKTKMARPGAGATEFKGAGYHPDLDGAGRDTGTPEERRAVDMFVRRGLERMPPELRAAINTSETNNGAEAVPIWFLPRIMEIAVKQAPLLALVQNTNPMNFPVRVLVSDGSTTGAEWVGELGTRNATEIPKLRAVDIPAAELSALPSVTQWALDDVNFNVEQWLVRELGRKFATTLEAAVISGDGTDKPTGMLAGPAPVTTADSSRAFGTLQYIASGEAAALPATAAAVQDKLIDLVHALDVAYRPNARFVMATATLALLRKYRDADGRGLLQPSLAAGQPETLMGFPVVEAASWPAVGAGTFAIGFGDFEQAFTLARGPGLRITRDEVTAPGFVKLYSRIRCGGKLVNSHAVKLLKIAAS